MAGSSNTQALIAAFAFGIVVNAATGTVFLYLKGHASSLWRDGLRLVLVTFLATSALWAQTDFITTLISVESPTGCQVAIVFASIFDQLARTSLQQAIIWAINRHGRVSPTESFLAQGAVLLRFVLGGVFVGLQRPQLDSVCVTSMSVLPYGFILLTADFTFTTAILARVISFGLFKDVRQGVPGSSQSRAAILIIFGFGTWTGTSVPLMLGIRSVNMIARTAVPAGGLSILIGLLALFKDSLTPSKGGPASLVEDVSAPDSHTARDLRSRGISTADTVEPPSRYDEVKDEALESFKRASQFKTTALKTVPGAPKSTLPLIAIPDVGQATTGIGGVPIQGHFFPPMKAQTMPDSLEPKKQRPDLFGKKVTKLMISGPVMSRDSEGKVLAKIPTVDLDSAILKEKQRVASGRIFAPSIRLASRTQLKPPPIPPKALNRVSQRPTEEVVLNVATPRGMVSVMSRTPTREISVASTSSVMLSPALEELRRRSPRQLPPIAPGSKAASPLAPRYDSRPRQYESTPASPQSSPMTLDSKPLPKEPPYSVVNFSVPVDARKSVAPFKHQNHKPDIRPSRQRGNASSPKIPPTVPSSPANSPVLTPTKFGLPTHPRESRIRVAETQSQSSSPEQMVMLMKTIEHNDPATVKSVVESTKNKPNKSNRSILAPSPRVVSVVHRPRPIPRWPEIDRAIFPAEGSPNMHEHKRSLSNGTSRNKKSMVFLDAANSIVPFPPLPKSAGTISRSQLGDTRSMTWDEKMEIFYPQTGSVRSSTAGNLRRRSRSVPDVPVLSMLLDEKLGSVSPHSYMHQAEDSARTSTTTQGISNLLEDFPRPRDDRGMSSSLKLNSAAYLATTRDVEPRSPKSLKRKSLFKNVADRRSSPVLPPEDLTIFSPSSEAKSRDDDASTNWGSIHSPVTFVNVQKARAVEVPTVPKVLQLRDETEVAAGVAEAVSPLSQDEHTEASATFDEITPNDGVESASDMYLTIGQRQGSPGQGWHRRVGEECPTFSERGQPARRRKVPPPAPLLLNRTNLVPMEIQAQPSPLESPNHALAAIQEQLNRLQVPGSEQRNRLTLLANLETELGQQEDQWNGLRGALMVRDSQSTLRTVTPNTDSVRDSRGNSLATTLREGYLPTNQGSRQNHPQQVNDGPAHSPSFQVSDPTQGDTAQQQLALEQAGEVGIRPHVPTETDMKENARSSRLAISIHLLRPEDTEGSESEYEDRPRDLHTDPAKALWYPISSPDTSAPGATQTSLWTPVVKVAKVAALVKDVDQIPTAGMRRCVRKDLEPLSLESSHLWEKPLPERRFSHHGLWRSLSPPACKPETKLELEVAREQPVKPETTRRPPRRTKRVTLLPDILESPKPIPDRRGTLGIFQFPWGEMSDIASLPERPSTMMAMPSLMTSIHGGFGANSTSFFEDYEAEEDGDSDYNTFSDSGDDEDEGEEGEGDEEDDEGDDDDGFDETVLWEIASLLKPSQERRSDSVFFPTERGTHQRGEDSAARLPSDEATDPTELVRRDNSEALRFVTANFASSEIEQLATQGVSSPPRTAVTATTHSGNAPTRDQNTPKSDGPHATATPMDTGQGTWRLRLRQGSFQGCTDEANLNSATDGAARTLAPKAELINFSGDKAGDSGDDVKFISNNRIPETERESGTEPVPPLHCCPSLAGAPMTTIPSAHETSSPHVPPIPVPPTSFSSLEAHPQQPPTRAWTLKSVHTGTPPRQLPVLPVASRVLLPSANISADTSAAAQDDFIIQTVPSDSSSPALPDFILPSSEQSSFQLSPQLAVPQHQTLLRNAYKLSHPVGPMAMLWSPPSAPILRPSKGLYQPDAETWSSYLPIESASRALPRKAELAALESTALWTQPPTKKPEGPSHDGLWGTKKSQDTAPAMWTKPAVIESVSYGLAQPDAELWSTYLSVGDETPRVKQRAAEPAVIESQSLWTMPAPAPVAKHDGLLWNSPKVAPKAVNFGLWAPSPVDATEVDEEPVGLFSLSHRRSDFRTSSLSPAALHMERKRRAPLQPFPDFVFAHLWNQAPLWDAAANYAKVKEREEIDALVLEGLFSLNHRRTNYRTTSEPPAALVTKTKPRILQYTLPELTSDSLWSVQSQAPAPVERDWLAISSGKFWRASSVASTSTYAAESTKSASTVASSVSSDDIPDEKPTRRFDATPAQWLEALREATAADKGKLSKDQAPDSSESPSFAYQLWSKRDDMADTADDDSTSMWKPSSSPTNNYLVLTATPGELDDAQLRASSATLRRNSKSSASRPPPPVFHGSTHSAFLPAVSETPRDFSAQALWSADGDAMEALEEERAWLDKSLRNGMALLQLG